VVSIKKGVVAAAMAGSALVGGALGMTVLGPASGSAATTSTTTAASGSSTTAAAPSGKFTPNEDATHEAGESAAREAQENAGLIRPGIRGCSIPWKRGWSYGNQWSAA
jgi:hypothetical protein